MVSKTQNNDRVAPDVDSDEHADCLKYVLDCVTEGEQNQQQYVDPWVESYRSFMALASATKQRKSRRPQWQSDIRNPYVYEQFMTLLPRMVDPNFKVDLIPQQIGTPRQSLRAGEKLIEHTLRRDLWFTKQAQLMQITMLFGIGWVKTSWLYEEKMRRRRSTAMEQAMGAGAFQDILVPINDRATNTVCHPFDVLWPARALTLETAGWVIHRYFDTVPNIRKKARKRGEDGRLMGLYDNTDQVQGGAKQRDHQLPNEIEIPKLVTGRMLGNEVEVIELYSRERDRLYTVVNRQIVLRDVRMPFWHGDVPMSMAITQPDVQQLVGINETHMLQSLQRMLWLLENQRLDNTRISMDIVLLIKDTVEDIGDFVLEPGAKWPVTNMNDVQPLTMPQPQVASSQDLEMLRGRMQALSGMTYLGGADQGAMGVNQNTASGLMAIQEESNRRVDFRLQLVRELCYQRVCDQTLALAQQFMDEPVVLPVDGRTQEMLTVTPELIGPKMWAHSRVLSDSLSKTLKGNNANQMMQSVAALMSAPIQTPLGPKNVSPYPVLELAAESIDRDVNDFLVDPPAPDPMQLMAQMGAGTAPPNPEGVPGDYGSA